MKDARVTSDAGAKLAEEAAVEAIVAEGPAGAFAVAGIATAIVLVLYFAFYFLVYLPRGVIR